MPWAQFDDHFHDSEGALIAGVEACGLHLWATTYCAAHLTDGYLPPVILKRMLDGCQDDHGAEMVTRLIDAHLWQPNGDGGYNLVDFLSANRARSQVEADRERKKKAGKKGGKATANRYPKRTPEVKPSEPEQPEPPEDDSDDPALPF